MILIQITDERRGLGDLIDMLRSIVEFIDQGNVTRDIRVGIDPMDEGVKFSVNGRTWSPPAHGVIHATPIFAETEYAKVARARTPMPPCGCKGDDCFQDAHPEQVPQRECRRGLPDE